MKPQGEPTEEGWRELAKQAAAEKDPNKMIVLVEKLIAKFNEGKQAKRQGEATFERPVDVDHN